MNIAIINGPNLNMLGKREKSHYGSFTLDQLEDWLKEKCQQRANLFFFQNNSEGELLSYIHGCPDDGIDAIIINAGAYTHTSIALRDALLSVSIPFVEVHISNVYRRETFRHQSYLSDVAEGVIAGLGPHSYLLALQYFLEK